MNGKRKVWIIFLKAVLVAALITADQIVKNLVSNHIARGSVVPLVKGIIDLTFPVFNIADICITSGAVLLLADLLFFKGGAFS